MLGLDTVFATPWQLLATAAVLFLAAVIYVMLGFGAGLLSVGALALILPDVRDAVVILLLLNLPAELGVVLSSWRAVRWRGVAVLAACIALGVPVGSALLTRMDPSALMVILGVVLVAAGAAFLAMRERPDVRIPRVLAPVAGTLSGLLSGLLGTGGPPLILYFRLAGLDKAAFRGTLMTLFLGITLIRVPSYAIAGLISAQRLTSSAVLLPAVLAGALVGNRIHLQLDERSYRRAVAVALAVLGIGLLLSTVLRPAA